MKKYFYLLLVLMLCPSFSTAEQTKEEPKEDKVLVIPIEGQIERGLVYVIRRGVNMAKKHKVSAIIFNMDTPGGRLDSTEEIINMIVDLDIPTYTYVNRRAISAGAIISFATDHIYMHPYGLIGDAMPILMSPLPTGGPQSVPDDLKEKFVSPTVALIRSCAQRKKHDQDLAECMVRIEKEYTIGTNVISTSSNLCTLTAIDAEQLVGEDKHKLLSEGTAENLDELLKKIGKANATVVTFRVSNAEKFARYIESFPISGIILALGILALYIEFKTPGFGLPGITGIVLLAIWFWGHNVAGLAGGLEIILFMLGLILIFVEIFVLPGFGITGIAGILLIAASILMAMISYNPFQDIQPISMHGAKLGLLYAIINASIAVLVSAGGVLLLARYLPESQPFKKNIMLTSSLEDKAGYQSSTTESELIGTKGIAETELRPAGIGAFGDKRIDVVSRGEFINKGSSIIIEEAHGNRIIVSKIT